MPLACDLAFLEAGDGTPIFTTDATIDGVARDGDSGGRCDAGVIVRENWAGSIGAGWPAGWTLFPSATGFGVSGGEGTIVTQGSVPESSVAVLTGKDFQNTDIRILMDASRGLGTVVLLATKTDERGEKGLAGGILFSSAGNSALLGAFGSGHPEDVPTVADFKLSGAIRVRLVVREVPSDSNVQLSMKAWAKDDPEPEVFQYSRTAGAPSSQQGFAIVVSGGAPNTVRLQELSIETLCP